MVASSPYVISKTSTALYNCWPTNAFQIALGDADGFVLTCCIYSNGYRIEGTWIDVNFRRIGWDSKQAPALFDASHLFKML